MTDEWGNSINTDSWNATLHTSQPILALDSNKPVQDFTFPLSKSFQFQPTKESTITFDIIAKHNEESVHQSLVVTVLDDIQIETNITHSGVIKV